ncbi:MAG: hypothetical protein WCY77_10645 [Weeksellaceae bacterium]
MKKSLLIILSYFIFSYSCDTGNGCSNVYNKQQNCNVVVTYNINKSSHWVSAKLKFKGIDLTTNEEILYKSKTRDWGALSDYINIGDTVVKNEGEIIMYVYKKDSIVKMNLSKICKEDFDLRKDVYTFILRDTIN